MTDTPVEALEPCPFCGGEAEHHDIGNAHTGSRGTKIRCTGCSFAKTVKAIRHDLNWTRAQAIAAWNRRALSTHPQAPGVVAGETWWALWSRSGAHIGLWPDEETAKSVAKGYAGCTIRRLSTIVSAPPVSAGELLLREVYINDAVWLEGLAFVSTPEKAERYRAIADRIRALASLQTSVEGMEPVAWRTFYNDSWSLYDSKEEASDLLGGRLPVEPLYTASALTAANADRDRLESERDFEHASLTDMQADRDMWKARAERFDSDRAIYAKTLNRLRDTLGNVKDGIEDEGDRMYFGSTNDADALTEVAKEIEGLHWDEIMEATQPPVDLYEIIADLRAGKSAAEADRDRLARELEELIAAAAPFTPGNAGYDGGAEVKLSRAIDRARSLTPTGGGEK